ncbi:small conductance calcium-activated potassium channel protein 2-like isoform X3 [Ruditapes philippinarum]|uniref:small conductance calcium-activated potassium channel protein 2-like isoform X3 n=1 Tax=Ruditapes philippinarum TaxID=129788 RepID=UPI00295AF06F|nr:small conductance calcium-activated potassium channel protein 2-like isoform X3 [Ruditapes philippinarum]
MFHEDESSRKRRIKEEVLSKMSGSTVIEDPGIPLVGKANGKFRRYVGSEEENANGTPPAEPPSDSSAFGITSRYDNIGYKLGRRKQLINRRRMIVNVEFTMAFFGIALMLVETECFIRGVFTKTDAGSVILKSLISLSTVVLLLAILLYHATGVMIQMADNSWEDWRLAMHFPVSYLKIVLELLLCSIHPIPGDIRVPAYGVDGRYRMVSLDAIFSILMLARLYLIGKFTVVHHRLLTDTSTQSLGALNKVKINTVFVFKALMSTMPGTMLISLMLAILVIGSWALRTCEIYYHPGSPESSYLNSMWLIAITFLTIGYGDFTPSTYCGRFVSVLTGLMGVGTTALLVAVLASKLEQTRPEKYVHNFVSRVQLDKVRKNAASDVIKYALSLWRMKRQGISDGRRRTRVYGKLLQSIYTMREAKNEKISIGESSVGIVEVSKSVNDVFEIVEQLQEEQTNLQTRVIDIEQKLSNIDKKLDVLISGNR